MGRAFKYVILGGGNSAGYAALEFSRPGTPVTQGEVCIISDESVPPYERPALSKGYLAPEGGVRLPSFHTCVAIGNEKQTSKWYKDRGIELLLNTRVVSADVKGHSLITTAGETITYQILIIATGARALRLEEFGVRGAGSCKRVCYLRDIKDAEKLVECIRECQGGQAVVVGGGYIGMEVAASLTLNRISVTMVFPETHLMTRLFTPEIADFYEEVYRRQGITLIKKSTVTALEPDQDGVVRRVLLKDGSALPCNMVAVGVGIRPNIALFEGQLAVLQGALKVDSSLRTSHPAVYAIGDAAAFPVPLYGDMRRMEHVDHARKSAVHAVRSVLSPEQPWPPYDYLPYFYSRVFSLSWQFFGDSVGTVVHFGHRRRSFFGAFWVSSGRVVGTFLEGGTQGDYAALERVARDQPEVEDLGQLAKQGIQFAREYAERKQKEAADLEVTGSNPEEVGIEVVEGGWVLSQQSFQAMAGVVVAMGIVAFAYHHGSRSRKW